MKVKLRKPTALLAAAAIAASAVPMFAASASAAVTDGRLAVGDTVKFDFGAAGQSAESGYYPVTPSTEFNANIDSSTGLQYGLYGNNINDYKLNEYVDGVRMVQGQITTYQAASASGSGADSDGVGPVEVTNGENGQLNGLYPIRFSMRDENNGYYKVKVTLAGLDSSKPAAATVYSERRHPIITDEAIAAGEIKTVEFTATTQNVAVKNRSTGGTDIYKDDTVNVMAVGENIAITSIEITKINHTTTIWCYDDSTGCDYSTRLPFFPYQNYGGTAQYLSKYLGEDIVLCNQGDGGINAADNVHWNAAKSSISAGDYVYVQYGHNHKNDGAKGYVGSLDKYYDHAHSVGAYTILAGPIDRHNSTQYNSSTNTWSSTLSSFSKAAKYYTELMILRGRDTASQFVTKVNSSSSNGIDASIYEWADAELAKGYDAENGRSDIAFVDLNQPTLDWLAQVCETVKTTRGDSNYSASNTNYYFQATKGASVDGTHPNDLGADATAKMFIDGASAIINKTDKSAVETAEAAVLTPLLTGARSNAVTYTASNEMIMAGNAVNSLYPEVYKSSNAAAYPTAVKNVSWNENGTIASVSILKQESTLTMSAYGVLELIVKDNGGAVKGTITSTQVDNTWTDGSTTSFSTSDDTNKLLGDTAVTYDKSAGDTFTATIWQATDNGDGLNKYIDETGNNVQYSDVYVPTELEDVLITDEDGNAGEDFDFYGVLYNGTGNLNGNNGWAVVGSASKDTALGSDNGTYYANIAATSATGSFMASKKLSKKISAAGRVKFSADLEKYSGSTNDAITLGIGTITNSNWPDSGIALLRVNGADVSVIDGSTTKSIGTLSDSAWTTVSGTLDFDTGILTTQFGGGAEVKTTIPNYATFSTELTPSTFTDFYAQGTSKKLSGVKISALSVEKYMTSSTSTLSVAVDSESAGMGEVYIGQQGVTSSEAASASAVTATAAAKEGYAFDGWYENDTKMSDDENYTINRLYRDVNLTAKFRLNTAPTSVTVRYLDANGDAIQDNVVYTELNGKTLYEQTRFALPEENAYAIKKVRADGLYDVYLYNETKSDSFNIESLASANTISIVFDYDGSYYEYEDFRTSTTGGFTAGTTNNVSWDNGVLKLKVQNKDANDTKTLPQDISGEKRLTVKFDWKNDVESGKGRNSLFNLYDSNNNIIFSINGSGNKGVDYAVGQAAGSGTNVGAVSAWYRIVLDLDFENSKLSGRVTNLSTGITTPITETEMTAANLASIKAMQGYSLAPQRLDNIGFKTTKPAVIMSDAFTSEDAGSDPAMAYVAEYKQNDYKISSLSWYVTSTNGNQYMDIPVANDIPNTAAGTTVQLGLILEGNINEVGNVTFTID